jgi:hypothetical protein
MQRYLRISKSYIQTVIKQGPGSMYADVYLRTGSSKGLILRPSIVVGHPPRHATALDYSRSIHPWILFYHPRLDLKYPGDTVSYSSRFPTRPGGGI